MSTDSPWMERAEQWQLRAEVLERTVGRLLLALLVAAVAFLLILGYASAKSGAGHRSRHARAAHDKANA